MTQCADMEGKGFEHSMSTVKEGERVEWGRWGRDDERRK